MVIFSRKHAGTIGFALSPQLTKLQRSKRFLKCFSSELTCSRRL